MTTGPTEPAAPPSRSRFRAAPWLVAGAPRGVLAVVGAVLLALGLFLFVRPLTAVGFLGIYLAVSCLLSGLAELADRTHEQDGQDGREGADRFRVATGVWWLLAGLTGLAWWGRDVDLFAPAAGVVLLVSGGLAVLRLARGRTWTLAVGALVGLAEILFGVLALTWPDATLIVVGILFGGRTAVFGTSLLVRGLLGPRRRVPGPPGRARTVLRVVLATAVLAAAVGTAWVSHTLRDGAPVLDGFYDTPAALPDEPGVLIRTAPYDGDLPRGMTGTRIYYTTTDADGEVIPSTGVLAVPERATGPLPLVTWAHGTVGIARACAPSTGPDVLTPDHQPGADRLAELGWAFVSSDYPGMGAEGATPYLVGEGEGRAVLDAARAAGQVEGVELDGRTVVWGHSQGGHGALWAGQLAPSYAPDLDVVGTAALSPASNPRAIADRVAARPGALGASLGIAFVAQAYADYYADLSLTDAAPPSARTLIREAASRCTGEGGTLVTILTGLSVARDTPLIRSGALDGRFGRRLEENIPAGPWAAPLFVGQGEQDEVIAFRINQDYVADLCAQGIDVEFHGYPGGTHMSVLKAGSALDDDVVAWTQDRLAGRPARPNCP
ncbi:lipase family protein [Nocardioides sp. LHD-245]|uniref:lipase family protein n=1 Tax=Nocardioides sp. LHD-245 TaxID=3051387 RepID=UPI0027DFECE1|nr:lipase family protein [Nocardioides sp. LHD-245]